MEVEIEKERNKKVILIKIKLNFQELQKSHGITDSVITEVTSARGHCFGCLSQHLGMKNLPVARYNTSAALIQSGRPQFLILPLF